MKRIAIIVLLLAAIGLVGCTPQAESTSAGLKTACFANEAVIKQSMDLFHADSGMYPPIATVVEKTGSKCPGGGTYSFDEATGIVDCSVHGHQ